ncbi:MAG: DUF418 domain-containing protein [Planctomycetota bacterium]
MDVKPAAHRDELVDALRGVAVMGILAVNIFVFAWPFKISQSPIEIEQFGHTLEGPNEWVYRAMMVLFSFKMQFLFGLLFGAGVVYYARKFDHGPLRTGAALWYRRMGVLMGLGLLHAIGLWYGDILVWYAALGLAALWWVRRWPVGVQIAVGVVLILYGWLANLGLTQLATLQPSDAPESPWDPTTISNEIEAHTGGYLGALGHRVFMLLFMYLLFLPFLFMPYFLGVMLLGMALLRTGVLRGERPGVSLALAGGGLALGLPLSLVALWRMDALGYEAIGAGRWAAVVFMSGAPTALGYVGLFTWLFREGRLAPVTRLLAPVGRMALTNYLSQTVICTTLFYGYGLGYYAKLDFVAMGGVVGAIWLFNIVVSNAWLARYRFGPMEWLWRTLTYGRPPAMTRD